MPKQTTVSFTGTPSRCRAWCYTRNNPPDQIPALTPHSALYHCYGRELAPTTGTPHLQGYVYFKDAKTKTAVVKLLLGAHVIACRGTPEENREYCKKDGDFFEEGIAPMTQAEKGEAGKEYWMEILSLAKAGKVDEIDPKAQIVHYSAIRKIKADYAVRPPDLPDVCGLWIVGPSGCGKSRYVRETFPAFFDKSLNKWWDGYRDESVVLLDDLDTLHAWMAYHLNRWADRYAFPTELKGSTGYARPNTVIVTSRFMPSEIFTSLSDHESIMRRFTIKDMRGEQLFPPFHSTSYQL